MEHFTSPFSEGPGWRFALRWGANLQKFGCLGLLVALWMVFQESLPGLRCWCWFNSGAAAGASAAWPKSSCRAPGALDGSQNMPGLKKARLPLAQCRRLESALYSTSNRVWIDGPRVPHVVDAELAFAFRFTVENSDSGPVVSSSHGGAKLSVAELANQTWVTRSYGSCSICHHLLVRPARSPMIWVCLTRPGCLAWFSTASVWDVNRSYFEEFQKNATRRTIKDSEEYHQLKREKIWKNNIWIIQKIWLQIHQILMFGP